MELSQSGLQQSNGLTVIPFKFQLRNLNYESIPEGVCAFIAMEPSGFLQVALGLINADLCPRSYPERLGIMSSARS